MIRLYHVRKSYDSENVVLRGVSLQVGKGEFAFLTGPSGAGKTTLLRMLIAAELPDRGQIVLAGRTVSHMPRSKIPQLRRLVGFVYQDFKLLQRRSVLENVLLALEVVGEPRDQAERKARTMLGRVGLSHRMAARPSQLSGGEQQRVAIARALVNDPVVLLADEPTGNLDPETTAGVIELFKWANARGTTVLLATHDQDLVRRLDSRVIRLEEGRTREWGEAAS